MQKTVQLSASFAGNLSRRFWFWFLAIQFSVATVVIVFTACVNYSLLSIVRTIYVAITIDTAVLTTVASFVLLWRLQLDSTGVTKLLHALVTGVIIGTALFCLTSQNFSSFSLTLNAGLLFEYLAFVCCSVVTVFASLVDIERRGGFNLLLPTASPKVVDNLRNLLSQNVLSWSSTSLFVGIFVVLVRQMTNSFYSRIFACMEAGNVCSYDSQQKTSVTVASICGPFIISFFLRSFIEIGHCLLVTALTHPLDFSKLDLMARSSNLITGGEDTFLSEALAIGGAKLGEKNFFWLQSYPHRSSMISSSSGVSHSNSSSSSSSSGSSSSSSSAIKALPFSKDRPTLTLALSSQGDLSKKSSSAITITNSYSNSSSSSNSNSNSILDILGGWRKGSSPWSEASEQQKNLKLELLKSVKPRLDGPPLLPYFCSQSRGLSQLRGVLCRSLGFQDLRRITASKDKVKDLFKAKGKWPEIVFSCCGIVDAAAIQLQLCVAYAVHEVIEPQLASVVSQAHSTASLAAKASHQSRPIEHMNSLVANGYAVPHEWLGSLDATATDVVKAGKCLREKSLKGRLFKIISSSSLLSASLPPGIIKSIKGVAEVDPDPIPSLLAQSVVHAVESMSLLLVSALADDPTGTAQHHLIAAMCSLLSLELGLKGHNDILKSCLATPKGTVTTAFLVSPSGGLHRRGITVSASLASMAIAVDAAILRLLDGYRDVLDAYVFPEQYANALKSRAA